MGTSAAKAAAALRSLADRVEQGEPVSPEFESALERELRLHDVPEAPDAIDAARGPVPQWVRDELDRRRATSSSGPKKPAREFLTLLSDDTAISQRHAVRGGAYQ